MIFERIISEVESLKEEFIQFVLFWCYNYKYKRERDLQNYTPFFLAIPKDLTYVSLSVFLFY